MNAMFTPVDTLLMAKARILSGVAALYIETQGCPCLEERARGQDFNVDGDDFAWWNELLLLMTMPGPKHSGTLRVKLAMRGAQPPFGDAIATEPIEA